MPEIAPRRRSTSKEPEASADTRTTAEQEQPLHVKYRPRELRDVIGQSAVTKSLESVLDSRNPGHSYLFTGPAGCGKTTLARILANEFKCDPANIIEVDAASNSGKDDMVQVLSGINYHGFGATPNRAYIIDECHALSKQAWDSLLKSVEEPPAHVYFFFCTTGGGKVPETIITRCHAYSLKPIRYDDLMDLLEEVANREKLRTPDRILQLVARACDGSARKALVMLSMVRDCSDETEAAALLDSADERKEVIDLCRALVSRKLDWKTLTSTLKAMPEMNAESVRIVVVNYLASCLMGATTDRQVSDLLDIMAPFSKPFNSSDKNAPLLLAFGNLIYPA